MKVFITGCTSLVGREVILEFVKRAQIYVKCFVRNKDKCSFLNSLRVELFEGDLLDLDSVIEGMRACDVVIHIAGIMFVENVLEAMKKNKIRKGLFVGTTGIYSKYREAASHYKKLEDKALDFFRKEKISYIWLRPTMIYGGEMDHNIHKIVEYLSRHGIFLIFGNGNSLIQPIYYRDVSNAIVTSFFSKNVWNKEYNISGGSVLKYKEMIEIIANTLNKKVIFIHIPVSVGVFLLSLLNFLNVRIPLKDEQIKRMNEDRAFDYKDAQDCFGYNPISFEEGIGLEVEELRKGGYLK
jgi:nucleoside-diphosphate-sugar epimerase